MSFELHDYPGMPSVCAICKHDDCSKPGEMWIHLVTVEDRPAIGMNCVRLIADNVGLTKPEVVEREVLRPPSDEEVGKFLREWVEFVRNAHDYETPVITASVEVKPVDDNHIHASTPADSTGSVARPRTDSAPKGKKRTD